MNAVGEAHGIMGEAATTVATIRALQKLLSKARSCSLLRLYLVLRATPSPSDVDLDRLVTVLSGHAALRTLVSDAELTGHL